MPRLHWHMSEHKKHDEIIVFVHHFGGNYNTSNRHVRFMNSLGYDCMSFTFSCNFDRFTLKKYIHTSFLGALSRGGIVGRWSQELASALTQIDRPIIIYSFSSLSLAVIPQIPKNPNKIKAWVCDGGPFLDLHHSFKRYYRRIHKIKNVFILTLFRIIAFWVWRGILLEFKTHYYLRRFPQSFPILSIRGEKDLLVPPYSIDLVFKRHPQLNLTVFNLKEGGHLDGLSRFASIYKPKVESFLKSIL